MFKIGDKVSWTSSAGGISKTKTGEVVHIISSKKYPNFRMLNDKYKSKDAYGGGIFRDHESYIILVPHQRNGKPTLYWPRVSGLKLSE